MDPFEEIADPKNDYNLNLPCYIDSSEPEDLQDIDGHLQHVPQFREHLRRAALKMLFLSSGKWITSKPVEITAEDVAWHRSEASADAYQRASDMLRENASVREIVQATGCSRTTV